MVLYDQNYNFLGMSSETLSYLGYEDLSDFTSQHSDFANLLVNKEGYIYKFENFSWIDFVLYSGSPNKAGLLKLKSGKELEIKISVKEVHLIDELNGSKKYYSIRILSDDFVQVASKLDATIVEKSPVKNNFNLNNLMSEETVMQESPQEEVLAVPTPMVESEDKKEGSFILNFPSQEELETKTQTVQLDLTETKEEMVTFDQTQETPIENNFKLNLSDSIFESESVVEEEKDILFQTQEPDVSLLKTEDTIEETSSFPIQEEAPMVSLGFLKTEEPAKEPVQKEEIISQIQQDIEEIDSVDEEVSINPSIDMVEHTDKKPFTSTLKSLFQESHELSQEQEIEEPTRIAEENHFLGLSSLGLDKSEEKDLLAEFIEDTQANITLFQEYHESGNAVQAEYTLIKIQSSAGILNLHAIIKTVDEMKQASVNNESEAIKTLLSTLQGHVQSLQVQIEHEAV